MAEVGGRAPSTIRPAEPDSDQFVADRLAAFQAEVLNPTLQQAASNPGSAVALIAKVREKLSALEVVLDLKIGSAGANGTAASPKPSATHPAFQAALERGRVGGQPDTGANDEMGRNARARLRELTLLEALAERGRAYTLPQLMSALAVGGFTDSTDAAVVSQLHRLKKNDVIHQPANGLYEITDSGLAHLRQLRKSVGALLG